MERFTCGTTVISGGGVLDALADCAGLRLLLVTDPLLRGSPEVRKLLEMLKPDSAAFFSRVLPEPTVGQALEGARFLESAEPELVIGIGGGNVLNCAKAMVCFAKHHSRLVVIPTAVGSLAETPAQVRLLHDRRYHTLRGERMRPDTVILDARFLQDSRGRDLADGGFSLLAGSLEAYGGKNSGLMTDLFAREAFSSGWAALPAAFSGRTEARKKILAASVMASIACSQGGRGLCGALCSSLESLFHLPAGRLAAVLLPCVIGVNAGAAGGRYAEIARAAGLGGSSEMMGVRNLGSGLVRLRKELGLPGTLAQAGIPPGSLWSNAGRIAELTLEDPECRNNPMTVDDYVIRRILEEATGRY